MAMSATMDKATLDADAVDHIILNLSNMYTDPFTAVAREWVANAVDSVNAAYEAGEIDTIDDSIVITMPTSDDPTFSVTDYGLGMTREHLIRYALNYGLSSKRDDAKRIGKFGLGFNSGLALNEQFIVSTVRDGMRTDGFLALGGPNEGVRHFAAEPQPTDAPNQTTVSVIVPPEQNGMFHLGKKMVKVLQGYNPQYFRIENNQAYIVSKAYLHQLHYAHEDNIRITDKFYVINTEYGKRYGDSITAVVGGVTYPIASGIKANMKTLLKLIEKEGAVIGPHALNALQHTIILDPNEVDIPDNRDQLIFNTRTLTAMAKVYAEAVRAADAALEEYTKDLRPSEIVAIFDLKSDKYTSELAAYVLLAQHWEKDIYTRNKELIDSRHDDVEADQYKYFVLINNSQQKPYARRFHDIAFGQGCIENTTPTFVTFDIDAYAETRDGENVYVTPKDEVFTQGVEFIERMYAMNKTKLNAWFEETGATRVVIGPTPEAFHYDPEYDFGDIYTWSTWCDIAQEKRAAQLAREKENAADDANSHDGIVATCSVLRKDARRADYHGLTTAQDIRDYCEEYSTDIADVAFITTNTGGTGRLRDIVTSLNSYATAEHVIALRQHKQQRELLKRIGATRIYTVEEYSDYLAEHTAQVQQELFDSYTDEEMLALRTYIWARHHVPQAIGTYHTMEDMTSIYRTARDTLVAQARDRGIDITTRQGYANLERFMQLWEAGSEIYKKDLAQFNHAISFGELTHGHFFDTDDLDRAHTKMAIEAVSAHIMRPWHSSTTIGLFSKEEFDLVTNRVAKDPDDAYEPPFVTNRLIGDSTMVIYIIACLACLAG